MPPKGKIAAKRNDKLASKKGRKKGSDDEAYVANNADKKKEKAEKDPNAPKKPQTAYFLFMNATRAKVKEAEPDLKFGEMTKKLTEMYKNLSEEEMKEWNEKAKEDKERYQAEMEAKGLAKAKKPEPAAGQPKKALSAFFLFSAEAREKLKDENIKQSEVLKRIGAQWKELSETNKKVWEKKAAADKERYDREMAAFKGGESAEAS